MSKKILLITSIVSFISCAYCFIHITNLNTTQNTPINLPIDFPKPIYNFENNPFNPKIFELGRKLFYDPILSIDNSTSCASCHQRIAAFAHIDHKLSHGFNGKKGKRNVPALFNLIWKDEFMADGSINHLEIQPITPITDPNEMGNTLLNALNSLKNNPNYVKDFKAAYGDTLINSERTLKAITQFVGLMISSNSRYDKFMRGEDTLSKPELKGLKIFRQHCENCHTEPLFTDNTYRSIGLKPDTLLNDAGRQNVTSNSADFMKFKVPSLRNIEWTYPYMHDGRFDKLIDAIKHYNNPEEFYTNADPTLLNKPKLSENELQNLLLFLLTLSDKTFRNDKRFMDPNFTPY